MFRQHWKTEQFWCSDSTVNYDAFIDLTVVTGIKPIYKLDKMDIHVHLLLLFTTANCMTCTEPIWSHLTGAQLLLHLIWAWHKNERMHFSLEFLWITFKQSEQKTEKTSSECKSLKSLLPPKEKKTKTKTKPKPNQNKKTPPNLIFHSTEYKSCKAVTFHI